ncbi:MAG: transposase [Clostridia bacterium]|nr:transposase [Clostridia bacterium]
MNELPKRKATRLKGYDYSQGGSVFITICIYGKERILSQILKDEKTNECKLRLSECGKTVKIFLEQVPEKYPCFSVDNYIIMPDHLHFIITKDNSSPNDISTNQIIGWLKYNITKEINKIRKTPGMKVFQRSYYDHIIISEKDYMNHWNYIYENPFRWNDDLYLVYPDNE